MGTWGDRRIVLYTLRVALDGRVFRTSAAAGEPFVANFNGSGADLLHFLSSFIEALPTDKHIERDERHFGQPTSIRRRGRTISWRMDGGESGRKSQIRLRRDADAQERDRSGVEWEPFWAFAVVPENSVVGWLLVEKAGRHSLPTEWRKELQRQFAGAYRGYRLEIGIVREMSLWAQVENALDEERLIGFEVAYRSASTTAGSGAAGYERGMEKYERRMWRAPADQPKKGRKLREFRRAHTKTLIEGTREIELPFEADDLSDDRYTIRLRDDVAEIKATLYNSEGQPKTVVFEGLDPQQTIVMEDTALAPPDQDRFDTECRSAVRDLAASNMVGLAPKWDTGDWVHPEDAVKLEVKSDAPSPERDQGSEAN
ncbi:hypothetical protein SEA_BLINO_45 [Gordonia phage Blino]|uniref:Uncharacterized protein n=1 Tax=Gordonia phage Blino TaxID=2793696 RepID=A0A7T0M0V0_9CAUD|nr:hypothetical protein BIZ75_gp44 [Gordonia phage CarolAnn]YP_010114134.1 hypothetical protein KNV70_gp45 [Gordonia phage Blino]AOE44061.1 hypothetical protein SEA_CAROLANN_44 [Gordonia phage CarolAnn]QPL13993.1 hypothetical protein SEA_BLINO_45 [Gordonia phage Blino]